MKYMQKKLLSEEEDRKLKELAAPLTLSFKELAKFFPNYTYKQIFNYCNHNKIKAKPRQFWTKEEDLLVRELCAKAIPFKDMPPYFNNRWSEDSIIFYCRGKKIENNCFNFWSDEEEKLLKQLLDSGMYLFKDLPPFFPKRNFATIMSKIFRMGLKTEHRASKYIFDQHYFDNLSLENCYWGGFLMADGCVRHSINTFLLKLTISINDLDHIYKFQSCIKSNHKIHFFKRKSISSDNIYEYCSLQIAGIWKWKDNLYNYFGMVPNKTKRFNPPKLNTMKEKLAFLKGYIDGDGHISYKNGAISIGITSSNITILQWIKDLIESLNLPRLKNIENNIITKRKTESCLDYRFGGFLGATFIHLMNLIDTPYLSRKWKQENILNDIEELKKNSHWPKEEFFQEILNR